MPAMTDLSVKDDAAISKIFSPVSDNPFPQWRENSAVVPLEGAARLSASVTKMKDGTMKITLKLEVPVMETLGSAGTSVGYVAPPKVAYVSTAIFTMFADRRSTATDRINTLRMAVGFLQGATSTADTGTLVNSAVSGNWAASAAPIVLLFKSLLLPN
jgi:hypothetical protein